MVTGSEYVSAKVHVDCNWFCEILIFKLLCSQTVLVNSANQLKLV